MSPDRPRFRASRERPDNQDPYVIYRFKSLFDHILLADWEAKLENRQKLKDTQREKVLGPVFGEVEIPRRISPSVACYCLRWVGYEALGYKPTPPTARSYLISTIGEASHWAILKKFQQYLPRGAQETTLIVDEADLSGRLDWFWKHPKTGKDQLLELKTIGNFPFRNVTREKIPEYLRPTAWTYWPLAENRKQVLLYLWGKDKEGYDLAPADILYINRDTGETKEALVVWDEIARFDAEELVAQVKEANGLIKKGQLPKPSVESCHVCGNFCPFRVYCEHGHQYVAEGIRKEAKKKRPMWVYRRAREEHEEQRQKMIKMGIVQAELPGFGKQELEVPIPKKIKAKAENEAPSCGECGQSLVWEQKSANGGKYVCNVHG